MKYHYTKPTEYSSMYGQLYECNHPAYNHCTLYLIGDKGLAVIQQRYDKKSKCTWWSEIDRCLTDVLYLHSKFKSVFDKYASAPMNGWNGKGIFVVYQKGYPDGIPCNLQTAKAWGMNEGDLFKCEPYLQIKTTDGSHAMWVPSIRDVLAEDWEYIH